MLFGKEIKEYIEFEFSDIFLIKSKNLSSISFTWTFFFLDPVPDILYRMTKWGLNRLSNDVLCDMFWCINKLLF